MLPAHLLYLLKRKGSQFWYLGYHRKWRWWSCSTSCCAKQKKDMVKGSYCVRPRSAVSNWNLFYLYIVIYENTYYVYYTTLLHNKHELDIWNDQFLGTVSSSFLLFNLMRVESWDLYLRVLPQMQLQVRAEGKKKNGNGNTGTAGYSSKVAMKVVQVVSKRTVSIGKRRNKVPTWLNIQDGCIFNWCGWKWTRTRISVASCYSKNKFNITLTCSWAFGQQ